MRLETQTTKLRLCKSIILGMLLFLVKMSEVTAQKKPNVILIMADDVGYECFGAYGSKEYRTPNLDALASGGARFTHAYSQPLCTPSRVKIMTGRRNIYNYKMFGILDAKEKTLAHYLKKAGYRTAVFGKWQLFGSDKVDPKLRGTGMHPNKAGFDEYCLWQIEKKDPRYWKPTLVTNGNRHTSSTDEYGPDLLVDFAEGFMERNKAQPFFLYYPMLLPHSPFLPTPKSSSKESKDKKKNFVDMVEYVDHCVGRLEKKLNELGIAENTFLIFTSDNGTHKSLSSTLGGKKIQGGKGKPTNAGTRVPLIASWPGTIEKGVVSHDLVEFTDFFATIGEATGMTMPEDPTVDGVSFLPQLKGKKGNPRDWIYIYNNPRSLEFQPKMVFVRNQRWKLYGDGSFYDIENDPLEVSPLTSYVGESSKAKKMLQQALDSMPSKPLPRMSSKNP